MGPVDSARRGALVREVPPAKEPAESAAKKRHLLVREVPPAKEPTESAAKKRQCERSPRPKERDECAIRASTEEG